jgi:2'-5' RNA ligase
VGGDDRIRLFCALRLPEGVLDLLVEWQATLELPDGVRLLPRENLHVTLAFLGWRAASDLEETVASLRRRAGRVAPPRFAVERYRETRSVGMVALTEDPGAAKLAYGVQKDLLGKVERFPWLPHITVLRFRDRPRLRPAPPDLGTFAPSDAAVYRSVLRPAGAQYEVLETVALGG